MASQPPSSSTSDSSIRISEPYTASATSTTSSTNSSTSSSTSTSSSSSAAASKPSSSSSTASTPAPSTGAQSSHSGSSGGSGGAQGDKKSMFDETPEEAAAKKEHLRKFATGDPETIKNAKTRDLDPAIASGLEADDSKDPFYNVKRAALADDYEAPHCEKDKEDEAVTVIAAKMLMDSEPVISHPQKTAGATK